MDRANLRAEERLDGKFLLSSTDDSLSAGELALLYKSMLEVERSWRDLKQVLDRFGGQTEYALAAYNAGDTPVRQWLGSNDYKDVAEFVESIPYTETRDYVQAILRNREMYRQLYPVR